MRGTNRLILLAMVAVVTSIAVRAADTPGRSLPTRQADISKDFAGSASCQRCHEDEHAQWARSLHVQMTRPVAEARILGDFNGVSFADHGRAYTMNVRDGRRLVSVSHGSRPPETFEVHYTLGAKRFQGYLSRLPEGRIYVLPVFWHVAQKRWVDWKEITPVPDGDHDLRQIWNATCFNCHATNLDAKFDLASKTFGTTWAEMGVTCEACHGPGRPHIALMEAWEKTGKPSPDAPVGLFAARRAAPRQIFDMCAYCHGNKNNLFLGFLPGERMEQFALPFLVSQPMPSDDPQGDFWPDGRPSRFNRPQALTLSGCFMRGNATCTNCHVAHGSRQEHSLKVPIAESDRLCTQCHQPLAVPENVERHTRHPATSQGSRCIECHMSDVNWRLLIRRRDHTFSAPVPEMTAKYGVPNGCTTCHEGRTPEWAATMLDKWYGDSERRARAMLVADTFYLAGAGDAAALPGLASLAVDRSRGMLIRASAAEFIGQVYLAASTSAGSSSARSSSAAGLIRAAPSQTSVEGTRIEKPTIANASAPSAELTTRIVNTLIGAINDPEPTVRAVAVRSLGAIRDRRAIMPVVSRLRDEVRAVRVSAAEALLWMGVSTLPGTAGELLTRAQDEYGGSLAVFPDIASNHATRGWLESERGRQSDAAHALDVALDLEPKYARAHVYRGIVYARTGQLGEAIKHWQTAKSIDPDYPNIDGLIEEAKRQSGR
jgi:predicted CXXCH cytochrome family protein